MIRTVSDRRVRAADDVEEKTGVAVVGTHPDGARPRRREPARRRRRRRAAARAAPSRCPRRCARCARTSSSWTSTTRRSTIVVTSPLPGDGKSTIACNLALDARGSGHHRRARRRRPAPLDGREDDGAARRRGAQRRARGPRRARRGAPAHARVRTTCSCSPPAACRRTRARCSAPSACTSLIADLAKHATVIIDAPPLLPVTDGAVLTHQADGALLVVTPRQDHLRPARQGARHARQGARPCPRHRAEQGAAARRRRRRRTRTSTAASTRRHPRCPRRPSHPRASTATSPAASTTW